MFIYIYIYAYIFVCLFSQQFIGCFRCSCSLRSEWFTCLDNSCLVLLGIWVWDPWGPHLKFESIYWINSSFPAVMLGKRTQAEGILVSERKENPEGVLWLEAQDTGQASPKAWTPKPRQRVSEEAWLMHSTSEIPVADRSISPPCGPRAENSEQTHPQCHSQLAVVF